MPSRGLSTNRLMPPSVRLIFLALVARYCGCTLGKFGTDDTGRVDVNFIFTNVLDSVVQERECN